MAITYPLSLPSTLGVTRIEFRGAHATAKSESPYTAHQQIFAHPAQTWAATVTIPPAARADAEAWVAWQLSLFGHKGTFLMGDPVGAAPRGTASSSPGTPLVNGADQTGNSLTLDGGPASETGWLLPGDYLQIGSASTATLHKVLTSTDTNGSGAATVDIWPALLSAPVDNATITFSNTVGRWRMSSNVAEWSISDVETYGITFDASQAVP